MQHPIVATWTDAHCRTIAKLALSRDHGYAEMLLADYRGLLDIGCTPYLHLLSNGSKVNPKFYVCINHAERGNLRVGRIVSRAGRGERVTYIDRNPCNLRPENLRLGTGRSRLDYGLIVESEGATL